MASNSFLGAYLLRSFAFFSLFLLVSKIGYSQKIGKYYVASTQKDGILYFIEPQEKFKNDKKEELFYDITYHTKSDSITLNFTYVADQIRDIDHLTFAQSEDIFRHPATRIFIDDDKNKWKHRYSTRISYEDFKKIIENKRSPVFTVFGEDTSQKLFIQEKKWQKESAILYKIFDLIASNKDS